MTIQISLVIWTVIGFTVLALILNRFLFKPLLKVMDARNEKIRKGEEERRAALEREEKVRKANEIANAARRQEAIKAAEKALENEQKKTESVLAEQKAKYEAALEEIRVRYDADTKAAEENLSEKIDKLALKYVKTQIL
jgi:F-type H+-transporting ATPase subunit b